MPLAALSAAAVVAAATLVVNVSAPRFVTDASFLGVNIDSASLTNYIDLSDPVLTTLAAQLSNAAPGAAAPPMHLRVGGSASNGVFYVPDGTPGRGPSGSTCVTDASLKALDAFAAQANLQVTFCLQYQTRDGKFDPSINATALFKMIGSKGLSTFSGFSLGNEIIGGQHFDVQQYADDYVSFRAAVAADAPPWAQSVVGPSAAGWPGNVAMATFLSTTASIANMSLSIHAYSFGNCSLPTYMSKAGIERMAYYYANFVSARDANAPAVPVYLEEMATQAGGGCDGLSNRFVSGFWFVHALGLAADMGVSRVTRQDLAGWSFTSGVSHYTLAGPPGWENTKRDGKPLPHPDYFVALLWRQLVGARVLTASVSAPPEVNSTFAVHAFCAAAGAPPGAIVLAFINLASDPVALMLGAGLAAAPRVEFVLTAPGGNLTADSLLLNNALLAVGSDGKLAQQPVPGEAVSAGDIQLPAESYGFLQLNAAAAPACS
jgi:hypothetical protein